ETEPLVEPADFPVLAPTDLMSQETMRVIEMLETLHFNNQEISDEVFIDLIRKFMESLDYNKLYFLQSDEDRFIDTFGSRLSMQLRHKGDLNAAFAIYETYRTIALNRINSNLELLKGEWTFEAEDEYEYDRTESPWATSKEDADKLWTKRLKQEMLQELLNDKTIEEAQERIVKRYERQLRSLKDFGSSDVQEVFLTSLTHIFDPHSTFFSSDTFEDFSIHMRLSLVGIGALLSEDDGYCVIKELIPGGPAKNTTDLKPDDRIVAVAQGDGEPVDIIDMGLRKVVDQIRGEKGTVVNLTIIPADAVDESERRIVSIVRDTVRINSSRCEGEIIDVPTNNGSTMPIGVIDIPGFYGSEEIDSEGKRFVTSVTADVEELVIKMKDAGVQAIVLDLRRNGGGLLNEAVDLTGLFISRGPVVQVKDSYGKILPRSDRNPKVVYNGPLAVLTSRHSASASEILAGALQNYGRALIIGNDSTHGKGSVQQVLPLEDYVLRAYNSKSKAGAAKLTIQKYYLPNGFSVQRKGVVSDISIPSIADVTAVGEADLDNALPWDYIKPARYFIEMTLKKSFVETLQNQSKQRQIQLEEFGFLKERIDWYQDREDQTAISLNLETRKQMMEEDKNFIDAMKDRQRKLAEVNFEAVEIKLDAVLKEEAENEAEEEEEAPEVAEAEVETEEPEAETSTEGEAIEIAESESENMDEEDEEPVPDFDIQLREALRIMVNAVNASPNINDWKQPALPLASKSRFEKLIN
ncbi:MAG: carboxy terminal-processing peptidase, partial [Opitutales bacterium]|nr:carboxy terminal-processing peptidase [Opitutales bacterium]